MTHIILHIYIYIYVFTSRTRIYNAQGTETLLAPSQEIFPSKVSFIPNHNPLSNKRCLQKHPQAINCLSSELAVLWLEWQVMKQILQQHFMHHALASNMLCQVSCAVLQTVHAWRMWESIHAGWGANIMTPFQNIQHIIECPALFTTLFSCFSECSVVSLRSCLQQLLWEFFQCHSRQVRSFQLFLYKCGSAASHYFRHACTLTGILWQFLNLKSYK